MHWKHYSGKIGSIPFFSSWNMQKLHHLSGCHAIVINSSLLFFSIALCFSYLMCHGHSLTIWLTKKLSWWDWKLKQFAWQKSCSDSRKNYNNMPDKKLFWIVIKITLFFIINSNNQELIYHSHSFGCNFIIKVRQRNFFDFICSYSMIFTLNLIHWMFQTFLIQQNIFMFIVTYCRSNIFVCTILPFHAHYYHLPSTNTSLALIQQILQS